jgi:hypothetical protein
MLTITVDIPANPGALDELEASLKDGGLDELRELFMWMAQVSESAIEVEVRQNGDAKRHSLNIGSAAD